MKVNVFDGNDELCLRMARNFDGEKVFLSLCDNAIKDMVDKLQALSNTRKSKINRLRLIGHGMTDLENIRAHVLVSQEYVTAKRDVHTRTLNTYNLSDANMESKRLVNQLTNFSYSGVKIPYAKTGPSNSGSISIEAELARLRPCFSSFATIDVMSCKIGAGSPGDAFLQSIADITGVKVRGGIFYQTAGTKAEAVNFEGAFKIATPGGGRVTTLNILNSLSNTSGSSMLAIALSEAWRMFR